MRESDILIATDKWIKEMFNQDRSGHDYWHMKRVVQMAKQIAERENANVFVCQMAAYLHDLLDEKFQDYFSITEEEINVFLEKQNVKADVIEQIFTAFREVSFKGNHQVPNTLEGKVVQDADRLDAIGAIGIARTFTYGGNKGSIMHDPNIGPETVFDTYRNRNKTTIYHFYEKLLQLKDLMNTETAKEVALKRHQYMENFLQQFYLEWEGTDI